jgi:LysR family hydrogen peroxide-inducible transcriptional activator
MVKAGTGITFMPKIAIATKEDGIEYIPFTKPAPSRSIGLVWRKTTPRQQVISQLINLI